MDNSLQKLEEESAICNSKLSGQGSHHVAPILPWVTSMIVISIRVLCVRSFGLPIFCFGFWFESAPGFSFLVLRADLSKQEKLQMKYIPGHSPLRGGGDRLAENQQILAPDEDPVNVMISDEGNILDQLPKEERRRLIKVGSVYWIAFIDASLHISSPGRFIYWSTDVFANISIWFACVRECIQCTWWWELVTLFQHVLRTEDCGDVQLQSRVPCSIVAQLMIIMLMWELLYLVRQFVLSL